MFLSLLLASSFIAAPVGGHGNGATSGTCASADIMMGSHKSQPTKPEQPSAGKLLPAPHSESKSPAVLLPECRSEPQKRRKRKSDYPMA